MDYEDIIYKEENGIATMTLNRPDRMNSFSPAMSDSMYRVVESVAVNDEVRVLVITGAGRAFCAGADVKAMAEGFNRPTARQERPKEASSGRISLHVLMQKCEKPIIAALNGDAVGGGLDLAMACDIRIASEKARFAELYIRRGIVPAAGGTYFLPRLVGIDKACQLIWTGDMIDAKEAERIGLVTMVVPHDELESATLELAEKLAKGPARAIQTSKRAIYDGLDMDLETTLKHVSSLTREIHQSEDHKEGARAFVEKREPVFRGE
ncbi:MAG: enoyl-CoA hydratase [Dehalococcoidales bacterium]|nr:MAG: enoyl-CoA hydratase [Dehalococcoidales bacterium]